MARSLGRGPARPSHPVRAATGRLAIRGIAWHDDLGGMGAGYASALGGWLHSALGPESDPTSDAISGSAGPVRDRPPGHPARRSSGRLDLADHQRRVRRQARRWDSGAAMPRWIRFRCHASRRRALRPASRRRPAESPGRAGVEGARGPARVFLAPAMRNMTDRDHPLGRFAECVDILSCNRIGVGGARRDPTSSPSRWRSSR